MEHRGRSETGETGGRARRGQRSEVGGQDLGLRISDFISQQMTAQRSDLTTAKPYDVKLDLSEALVTSPLCLVP